MRILTGKELDKAVLQKQRMSWDSVPVPKLRIEDLDKEAITLFKEKAIQSGRLSSSDLDVDTQILMENLNLIDEDGYLTRAAMLAFSPNPEKWAAGAYIKIGYFEQSDSDLRYQDEVHGPLLSQIDKAIELLYTKYLKALIYYKGIQRIERFMFPKEAFREILLNAVIHKDYASCNPVQISVYEDKIYVWNAGEFPEEVNTPEKLFNKHPSIPYNPKLAAVFFKSGMVEVGGRGFDKIKEVCGKDKSKLPEYDIGPSGVMVLCLANEKFTELSQAKKPENSIKQPSIKNLEATSKILEFCREPKTASEIMKHLGFNSLSSFRKSYLNPLLTDGRLKRTLPEKPTSKYQKYYSKSS